MIGTCCEVCGDGCGSVGCTVVNDGGIPGSGAMPGICPCPCGRPPLAAVDCVGLVEGSCGCKTLPSAPAVCCAGLCVSPAAAPGTGCFSFGLSGPLIRLAVATPRMIKPTTI